LYHCPICLRARLPVGLQIIGNFFDEGRILQVAHAYEAASGFRNLLAG